MDRTGLPSVSTTLRIRRQRLLGHCFRSQGRSRRIPLALALLHAPSDRFRRGHGTTLTLRSTFLKDLSLLDLTPSSTIFTVHPLRSHSV